MLGLWFAQDAWSIPSKIIVFCLLPGYCLFLNRSWPCRKTQNRRKAVEKKFTGKWSEWFLSCKTSKMTKKRKMQFWLFNWESSTFRSVYISAHVFAWIARGTLRGFLMPLRLICTTLGSSRRWKLNDTVFKNVWWGAVSHKRPFRYISFNFYCDKTAKIRNRPLSMGNTTCHTFDGHLKTKEHFYWLIPQTCTIQVASNVHNAISKNIVVTSWKLSAPLILSVKLASFCGLCQVFTLGNNFLLGNLFYSLRGYFLPTPWPAKQALSPWLTPALIVFSSLMLHKQQARQSLLHPPLLSLLERSAWCICIGNQLRYIWEGIRSTRRNPSGQVEIEWNITY